MFSDSEDVLTADGTGASSNGANTTLVTSDENTPATQIQNKPQQQHHENEKKSKAQQKQKRKYQQQPQA